MDPTLAGFMAFITGVMGINTTVLPANSAIIPYVYNMALNTVNVALAGVPNVDPTQPSIYAVAVYNLAGDYLVNFAPDQSAQTYFADLRKSFGVNSFVSVVINSTSDEGTSESMTVPKAFDELTIGNLQNLKTPWGRVYLGIAQSYGTLWGLS